MNSLVLKALQRQSQEPRRPLFQNVVRHQRMDENKAGAPAAGEPPLSEADAIYAIRQFLNIPVDSVTACIAAEKSLAQDDDAYFTLVSAASSDICVLCNPFLLPLFPSDTRSNAGKWLWFSYA